MCGHRICIPRVYLKIDLQKALMQNHWRSLQLECWYAYAKKLCSCRQTKIFSGRASPPSCSTRSMSSMINHHGGNASQITDWCAWCMLAGVGVDGAWIGTLVDFGRSTIFSKIWCFILLVDVKILPPPLTLIVSPA